MFKLLRFYSIASFVIIFVAAALVTLLYRQVTIQWIDDVADKDHLVLAQTALNSVKPKLAAYLDSKANDVSPRGLQPELAIALGNLLQDSSVNKINIYDRRGMVAFSTQSDQIIANPGNTPGFISALNGGTFSHMEYRDMFNRLSGTTADDNLMKTFIPIRKAPAEPILGVFEMHTDMSPWVLENERRFLIILFGSEFILAILYGVLLLVVRRARNIIETQQKDIQERTANLEILSRKLLDSDEQQKKRIAFDLHEGLAQTLAAIKLNAENNRHNFDTNTPLESIVPVLQSAIHEVRNIATELRPSSLDDFGLLSTINSFCREFERMNPDIRVEQEHCVQGRKVPEPLKIVIYRIIKSAFNNIALSSNTDRIRVALQLTDDMITLTISDIPTEFFSAANADADIVRQDADPNPKLRFTEMHDRTIISGGVFTAKHGKASEVTLRASWAY